MRICKPVAIVLFAFCVHIFARHSASAQTPASGPSGEFVNGVSGHTNAVWDFPAITGIRNVAYQVLNARHLPAVDVSYTLNFGQEGSGLLYGAGPALITVRYSTNGSNFISANPFLSEYGVSGRIKSSRGTTTGYILQSVFGPAFITSTNRKILVFTSLRVDFTFNNVSNTFLVKLTDVFFAPGVGAFRSQSTQGPGTLNALGAGDGTWMLKMDLLTDSRNRVTGTAQVGLNSGRTFDFSVRGLFKPTTGKSTLVLSGLNVTGTNIATRLSRGSTLQVTMNGDSVATIKGKLSGQTVNAAGADISAALPTGTVSFWSDIQTTGPIGVGQNLGQRVNTLLPSLTIINHEFPGMTSTFVASNMLASAEQTNATVLWVGNNNFSDTNTVVADINSMVSSLSNNTPFLVLGLINTSTNESLGTSGLDQILYINNTLSNAYGSHYVDTRLPLLAAASTNDQDQADVAAQIIPSSLRNGDTNINDQAYSILTTNIANALRPLTTRSP